ncbi:ArsR family transcriptional regulator [Halobacterium sp. R2-5]|uniref:DUF7344 domain-containing protein n=1 Tax=Halobacterium sp. R2-5 TaxID=2715751 RepID=UPI00141DE990|nr:ArsR family transcriptional regulator [Halobacterium sp. R2-5]NIB99556.1 ArsR family transcriptional regulator [Halobacterium sp. R2-5]
MTDDSLDTCLELVADVRRRRVIRELRRESDTETTVDELVERLRREEAFTRRGAGREDVVRQLYHHCLPKLDDHGVVDFDPDRQRVRYRVDDTVEAVLDSLPEEAATANN